MARGLSSEWIKMRSLRSTALALVAAVHDDGVAIGWIFGWSRSALRFRSGGYGGPDIRGLELELVAIVEPAYLLVIHVTPYRCRIGCMVFLASLRGRSPPASGRRWAVPMGPDKTIPQKTIPQHHAEAPPVSSRHGGGFPSSRVGRAWTALLPAALVLIVVLIFVLQNLQRSDVSFLIWSGGFPLGVALLASAALGGLAVFLLGSVRILQLRRMTRRRASL